MPKTYTLESAIEEIQSCGFACEAGPIENSVAWETLVTKVRTLDSAVAEVLPVLSEAVMCLRNGTT
jgi:hypothetical protein